MKIKKRLLSLAVSIVCTAGIYVSGTAPIIAGAETYGVLTYKVVDNNNDGSGDYVEITDCDESATSVEIPAEIGGLPVTSIGYYACSGCPNLTSVSIPDSVTSIDAYAFAHDTSLTSIAIPGSVKSIGNYAFSDCYILESITVSENNPSYASEDGVFFSKDKTNLICYPAGRKNSNYDIPYSVRNIEINAFSDCTNLTSVTIPDGVTTIGNSAFYWCLSLTSVSLPDSVTNIGFSAFAVCSLKSITLPSGLTSIGANAFYGCDFTSVTIPDSVTSIGESAFFACEDLKSITLPKSILYIKEKTFANCISLSSITIPDSVIGVGAEAFSRCLKLSSVTIPDNVKTIENGAFSKCEKLESITIENPECEIYNNSETSSVISNVYDKDAKKSYFYGMVYGAENSTAQSYADKSNYKFLAINEYGVIGDANKDGNVTALDASMIFSEYKSTYSGGTGSFTPEKIKVCDVNGDEKITALDASKAFSVYKKNYKRG